MADSKISANDFESRFRLACNPKESFADEIDRLFKKNSLSLRTFCDYTELDETMFYRLQRKDASPTLATVISICVGLSLDTMTARHLIALAGYNLRADNQLHLLYCYLIEKSGCLTIGECNEFLRSMDYRKKGELLGSQGRT